MQNLDSNGEYMQKQGSKTLTCYNDLFFGSFFFIIFKDIDIERFNKGKLCQNTVFK